MAITFTCLCGKPMKARDEFAGRKMRCSACKKVVTIPETAPPTVPPSESETIPVPADALAFLEEKEVRSPLALPPSPGREDEEEGDGEDVPKPGPHNLHPWQDRSFDQIWTVG